MISALWLPLDLGAQASAGWHGACCCRVQVGAGRTASQHRGYTMSTSALASLAPAPTLNRSAFRWRTLASALAAATLLTAAAPEAGAARWAATARQWVSSRAAAAARSTPMRRLSIQARRGYASLNKWRDRRHLEGVLSSIRSGTANFDAKDAAALVAQMTQAGVPKAAERVAQAQREGRGTRVEKHAAKIVEALEQAAPGGELPEDPHEAFAAIKDSLDDLAALASQAVGVHREDGPATHPKVAEALRNAFKRATELAEGLANAALGANDESSAMRAVLALNIAAKIATSAATLKGFPVKDPKNPSQKIPLLSAAATPSDPARLKVFATLIRTLPAMAASEHLSLERRPGLVAHFATSFEKMAGQSLAKYLATSGVFARRLPVWAKRARAARKEKALIHEAIARPALAVLTQALEEDQRRQLTNTEIDLVKHAIRTPGSLSRQLAAAADQVVDRGLLAPGARAF